VSSVEHQRFIQPIYERVKVNRPFNGQEVEKLNKELSILQNFQSNSIEGSSLTLSETKLIVLSHIGCSKSIADIQAAVNHDDAWRCIMDIARQNRKSIDVDFILKVHFLVMQTFHQAFPGKFRNPTQFAMIRSAKVLCAHGVEVESLMKKLVEWLHATNGHPIDIVVNFHQRFLRIHPFADGNGRTCRLLCTLIAVQEGYGPLILHDIKKENYFKAIRAWDLDSDTKPIGDMIWEDMAHTLIRYIDSFTQEMYIHKTQ